MKLGRRPCFFSSAGNLRTPSAAGRGSASRSMTNPASANASVAAAPGMLSVDQAQVRAGAERAMVRYQ